MNLVMMFIIECAAVHFILRNSTVH